jgi:hypothetical protein
VVVAVIAVVQAGQEAPPAKAHTFNVPSVGKVTIKQNNLYEIIHYY